MYRCFVCDSPAEQPHHADCPMGTDNTGSDPWWSEDTGQKINVASGEDVVLA